MTICWEALAISSTETKSISWLLCCRRASGDQIDDRD
jgi:hypothetical protein